MKDKRPAMIQIHSDFWQQDLGDRDSEFLEVVSSLKTPLSNRQKDQISLFFKKASLTPEKQPLIIFGNEINTLLDTKIL
jgi:hypothetical protein